ncbi:MAG: OmpH family outer membrane protein [Bacteroidia bacterium]|nr:OmpH family outer membrane protein [Bacteroidia bacterium]MCZ2277834.1 OmpH family outer membrane protein [Bacteroidia bacterium]
MKTSQSVINILLAIAVLYLLYRVVFIKPADSSNKAVTVPVLENGTQPAIVFINTDSLLEHYPLFEDLRSSFEKKQDSIEGVMAMKMKAVENEIKKYQDNAPGMTDEQRQKEEERLYQKQQQLAETRKRLIDHLNEEEENMMNDLQKDLVSVLKDYNKDKGYHFILGYQKGSGILLANDSLNITDDVIREVNNSQK